jgi:hypothetical protein
LKEIINFESELFNLSKINPLVSRYKLYIAYADEPANNYKFSEEVLNKLSSTIMGCPVVAGFMNEEDGSLLGGHESDLALDKNNRIKPTPTPIPVGFAAYDINPWFEEFKGRNYLTTFIYIWDGRYPELSNLSERKIFQSLEVAIDDKTEGEYKIVTEAFAFGLCLLENTNPAFQNSTIEKFSLPVENSEIELLKQEYENFTNTNTNKNVLNVEGEKPDTLNKSELSLKEDNSKEIDKEGDNVIKEAVEKFSLNANQIHEILNNALSEYKYKCGDGDYEYRKYWVRTYDAELVYVSDYEFDKTYSFKYTIDNNVASVDMESKDEVIDGGYISVNKKAIETEHMASDDINTEATAAAELNNKQAEIDKELNDEGKEKLSSEKMPDMEDKTHEEKMMAESESNAMKASMDEMKSKMEEMKKLMDEMKSKMEMMSDENNKLKEEKLAKQEQEKLANIEFTLQEVSDSIPKEKIEELREDSKNFSLENITIWENKVKAEAFSFSKGKVKDEGFTRMGLPHSDKSIKKGTGIWDKI